MSADLLRRAADLIEQRADAASGDRWEAVENYPEAWVVRPRYRQPATRKGVRNPPEPDWYLASESSRGDMERSDVEWMTILGPQVAAPLAAWLRAEASLIDNPLIAVVGDVRTQVPNPAEPYALAFARTIIGDIA